MDTNGLDNIRNNHFTTEEYAELDEVFKQRACNLVLLAAKGIGLEKQEFLRGHPDGVQSGIMLEWLMAEVQRRLAMRKLGLPHSLDADSRSYETTFKELAVNPSDVPPDTVNDYNFHALIQKIGDNVLAAGYDNDRKSVYFVDGQILKCWATAYAMLPAPEEKK